MPAVITAGTVTATQGSRTIVGNATARAAWPPDTVVDRYVRLDGRRNWYRIVGTDGSGDLVLESSFVESTAAGVAYKLAARFLALPEGLRHVGVFGHPRLYEPLEMIDPQEMDQAMVSRVLVADLPKYIAERGVNEDGRKLVEIYPYVKTDQLITFIYWAHAPVLTLDSPLPSELDPHILKVGALVDLHRWEMAKALRGNQVEAAGVWRNEMNSLVTRWEEKIKEAIKQDRATNTISFQMETGGFPRSGDRMIRNAYDMVYTRGNRP